MLLPRTRELVTGRILAGIILFDISPTSIQAEQLRRTSAVTGALRPGAACPRCPYGLPELRYPKRMPYCTLILCRSVFTRVIVVALLPKILI